MFYNINRWFNVGPRKRDGKIIYQNGQDKGWVKTFERLKTERNGEKWLPDHS